MLASLSAESSFAPLTSATLTVDLRRRKKMSPFRSVCRVEKVSSSPVGIALAVNLGRTSSSHSRVGRDLKKSSRLDTFEPWQEERYQCENLPRFIRY